MDTTATSLAVKKATVIRLLEGYPSSAVNVTEATVGSILEALTEYSIEAVARACARFAKGQVDGHNNSFPPSGAELAVQSKLFDDVLKSLEKKEPPLHNGLLEIDCGHGRINLRGLTADEQDEIIRLGGISSDGRNMAGLALEQLREALTGAPMIDYEARQRQVQALLKRPVPTDV